MEERCTAAAGRRPHPLVLLLLPVASGGRAAAALRRCSAPACSFVRLTSGLVNSRATGINWCAPPRTLQPSERSSEGTAPTTGTDGPTADGWLTRGGATATAGGATGRAKRS